jgi:hypothetical protein
MKRRLVNLAAMALMVLSIWLLLSRKSVTLYERGAPNQLEIQIYVNDHRGARPPLPSPIRATYMLLDANGLSFFRQSYEGNPGMFAFMAPGIVQHIDFDPSRLRYVGMPESLDIREDGEASLGFVWHTGRKASRSVAFRCRQITVPRWFLMACAAAPALTISGKAVARSIRQRNRISGICATCGYDLRESPDRCPECGTANPASNPTP